MLRYSAHLLCIEAKIPTTVLKKGKVCFALFWFVLTDWENHALLATSIAAGINGFYCLQFLSSNLSPDCTLEEETAEKHTAWEICCIIDAGA